MGGEKTGQDAAAAPAASCRSGSALLLESLLHMSGLLGYRVVAEGVERLEQLQVLKEKGCANCQGYLLGRPVPEQDVLQNYREIP